jgi:translation elongation factor EF-Ts
MSGYDTILKTLRASSGVGLYGSNMSIGVDEGDLDLAIRIIEDAGGVVTGTNSHEAGHTIYFEA